MTKDCPSLSMVVSIYNEEELIENFIRRSIGELRAFTADFEIVAVDDGSTDETPSILELLDNEFRELVVVRMEANSGIGAATVRGLKTARKSIVFWNTVDRVIDTTECLKRTLVEFQKGADAVAFYRTDLSGSTFYQKIMTCGNIALIMLLFQWRFKAYQQFQFHRKAFVDRVVFEANSTFVNPELLFKGHVAGLKITELGTKYHGRLAGRASGGRLKWVWATYRDIMRLWFLWVVLRHPMKFVDGAL